MAKKTKAQLEAELHQAGTGAGAKILRKKLGLNQKDFWARVGTTQSGGSRYESGREMPEATAALLALVYAPEGRVGEVVTRLRAGKWDFNAQRPSCS